MPESRARSCALLLTVAGLLLLCGQARAGSRAWRLENPVPSADLLTDVWAPVGHLLTPLTLLVGGYLTTRYARRHWPLDLSQLLAIMAAFSTALIFMASATRVGYLIYPLNFMLWSRVCAPVRQPDRELADVT